MYIRASNVDGAEPTTALRSSPSRFAVPFIDGFTVGPPLDDHSRNAPRTAAASWIADAVKGSPRGVSVDVYSCGLRSDANSCVRCSSVTRSAARFPSRRLLQHLIAFSPLQSGKRLGSNSRDDEIDSGRASRKRSLAGTNR